MNPLTMGSALLGVPLSLWGGTARANDLRNPYDRARDAELKARAGDWRNGAVVYQVFVDRFAPSTKLSDKRALYEYPRRLRAWDELPAHGQYLSDAGVWSHEVDYWGGDLASLQAKLPYLHELGADVLYLNPIFLSLTNHKYDTWDYLQVDPVYGNRQDLAAVTRDAHSRGMKVMLDGVFNHMGRKSPRFQEALRNPQSPWRNYFRFHQNDYLAWMDVENLPELNLENPKVQDYLWAKPGSVVQSYLRQEGIDGWRLDVAFDLGFSLLQKLTHAAHSAKPGSAVIGEVWNYPEEWHPAVDGVMNMHGRALLLKMLEGKLSGSLASSMWETMIKDAGLDHLLKAWLVLDNHDTPRLTNLLPSTWQQQMARVLQLTLPGSPCLYYGTELGMSGGNDPEMRAPMRWDLATPENEVFAFNKRLLAFRKAEPALRYGDFRRLHSAQCFAFLRRTNAVRETVVVVVNPNHHPVTESLQLRESKFQDYSFLKDPFTGNSYTVLGGMVDITLAAHEWAILKMDTSDYPKGYNRYDRLN